MNTAVQKTQAKLPVFYQTLASTFERACLQMQAYQPTFAITLAVDVPTNPPI
jgi:hypothetical protein